MSGAKKKASVIQNPTDSVTEDPQTKSKTSQILPDVRQRKSLGAPKKATAEKAKTATTPKAQDRRAPTSRLDDPKPLEIAAVKLQPPRKSVTKTSSVGGSNISTPTMNASKTKSTEQKPTGKLELLRRPRKKREKLVNGEHVISSKVDWQVAEMLGSGGYGDVYKVTRADEGKGYAMKTEAIDADLRTHRLKLEVVVLEELQKAKEADRRHFTDLFDKGMIEDKFKFIVMTLVGPSLDDVRRQHLQWGQFSSSTATQIARQTLEAIRDLHKIGFIHRDIKPQNFAIGINKMQRTIYLLDFGICRRYLDRATGLPKKPRKKVRFIGSLRYASRRCHENKEQDRKDDLEAWFYLVFDSYDEENGLPWKKFKGPDRIGGIYRSKVEFMRGPVEKLSKEVLGLSWWGKVPPGYLLLIKYVNGLERFEQAPNYEMMLKVVDSIAGEGGIDMAAELDWEKAKSEEDYSEEKTQLGCPDS